jgi:hypothetical protein
MKNPPEMIMYVVQRYVKQDGTKLTNTEADELLDNNKEFRSTIKSLTMGIRYGA